MNSIFLVFEGDQDYPAICVYYYCSSNVFVFLSLLPVVLHLLPFVLPDYLSICNGICVSFGVLICSVCIWVFPIQHRVRSCFYL